MHVYYLLYKLNSSKILWIVKTSLDIGELQDHMAHYISSIDKYIIISRYIKDNTTIDNELKHKQFRIFTSYKNDVRIDETLY
jgi:hypothetical protein